MVPEEYRDIFAKRAFAHVATIGPDGAPQTTPVWIELHDGNPRFSTTKTRAKYRNLRRDGRSALSVCDPDDPERYVQVRGTAVLEDDPEKSLIHALAWKYTGAPFADEGPEIERVIVTIVS